MEKGDWNLIVVTLKSHLSHEGGFGSFSLQKQPKTKSSRSVGVLWQRPCKMICEQNRRWALEEAHGSTCTPFSFPQGHTYQWSPCARTREQDTKPTINAITWLQPMYPPSFPFFPFPPQTLLSHFNQNSHTPQLFPFSNTHFYLASDSHRFFMVCFDHHDLCGNQMGWISTNPFHFPIEVTSFQAIGITCSHTALKRLDPQNP